MTYTPQGRPSFTRSKVHTYLIKHYGLDGKLEPLPGEWDQNFRLVSDQAGTYVVKIAHRDQDPNELDLQNAAMDWLVARGSILNCPEPVKSLNGETIRDISSAGKIKHYIRVLTYLPGKPLAQARPLLDQDFTRIGYALGDLDKQLLNFQHPAMLREHRWDLRQAEWISTQTTYIADIDCRAIVERHLLQYRARIKPVLAGLSMSVIHNDANDENLLLEPHPQGGWQVAGLVDYGDMLYSHTVNDLAITCAYAIFGLDDPLSAIEHLCTGYHQARPLSEGEIQVLFPLILLRLCVSVTNSAKAAQVDPNNKHRLISDQPAWKMLKILEHIDWRHVEVRLRRACQMPVNPTTPSETTHYPELMDARHRQIGTSLSLSYQRPLLITRGRGQFLFEATGRAYLDCVNNVCHVGHSHPKVVEALSQQAALLNTNTRYLHPNLLEFARRLTETLPTPLRVCYFVNSGSEANELAVRLARAYRGRKDVIVIDGAYHGNTTTLVDLSPYKSEGPGGKGMPDWAHKTIIPDPYRGLYRGMSVETGQAYADRVDQICRRLVKEGRPPALFLCESILGVAGQIVLPPSYLQAAFRYVRAVGGVCIVDEVQVGMGRVGSHMWAFETQGVVPDIVTIGKPIGNGHPLGAVVTTAEIAGAFDNGMEFFSTFGGNPVSMAVGLAVLDVIEEEDLRNRATKVGQYLRAGFRQLADRHKEIGDVRGLGLFMGVELVLDRQKRTPATELTTQVVEQAKADGVLLSAEGPDHNVLKIKPPMQFSHVDADLLLSTIDRALSKL
jgi:4-aminobutyrate aminotransferase-like enzyme